MKVQVWPVAMYSKENKWVLQFYQQQLLHARQQALTCDKVD